MKTKLFLLSIFGLFFANAQTINFKHLTDMSMGRGAISSVIVDYNIYVSNGYKSTDGNANFIEKYSIKDNHWSVINAKLPKRFSRWRERHARAQSHKSFTPTQKLFLEKHERDARPSKRMKM